MRLARVAFIVVGGDDDRGELLQAAGSQSALSLDAGWNDHHTSDAFPRTARTLYGIASATSRSCLSLSPYDPDKLRQHRTNMARSSISSGYLHRRRQSCETSKR